VQDAFGNPVHCSSPAAVRAYDRAVDAYLHAFPGVLEATDGQSERHPTDIVAVAPALGAYGLFAFSGRRDHDAARLALIASASPGSTLTTSPGCSPIGGGAASSAALSPRGWRWCSRRSSGRPANGHNAHMVMHGYYENGEHGSAQAFIAGWLPSYPDHALMWGHLQWHWALTDLGLGREDLALARLLGPILDHLPRGAPFMGLPDTASLLWRLGLRGIQTSAWSVARDHTRRCFPNGSNTFGEVHLAMLAAAYQDRAALEDCERRLQSMARSGHAGAVAALHWAAGLKALLDGDAPRAAEAFDACCAELPRLGGSHAQRSVVEETRAAQHCPSAEAGA
jgi:hypothetical protein